jgi:hypothetical protein
MAALSQQNSLVKYFDIFYSVQLRGAFIDENVAQKLEPNQALGHLLKLTGRPHQYGVEETLLATVFQGSLSVRPR